MSPGFVPGSILCSIPPGAQEDDSHCAVLAQDNLGSAVQTIVMNGYTMTFGRDIHIFAATGGVDLSHGMGVQFMGENSPQTISNHVPTYNHCTYIVTSDNGKRFHMHQTELTRSYLRDQRVEILNDQSTPFVPRYVFFVVFF